MGKKKKGRETPCGFSNDGFIVTAVLKICPFVTYLRAGAITERSWFEHDKTIRRVLRGCSYSEKGLHLARIWFGEAKPVSLRVIVSSTNICVFIFYFVATRRNCSLCFLSLRPFSFSGRDSEFNETSLACWLPVPLVNSLMCVKENAKNEENAKKQ